MRYVQENLDGSVALIVAVPTHVIRQSDGVVFAVNTYMKNEERDVSFLRGGNNTEEFVLVIGNFHYDIADLQPDSVPGYIIQFPDFELDIKPKWPKELRDKIKSHRVGTKEDFDAGNDRQFRNALREVAGKVKVDMAEARKIAKDMIERETNIATARNEAAYLQLLMNGGNTQTLNALAAKNKDLKGKKDDPRIQQAQTPAELKQVIETLLMGG